MIPFFPLTGIRVQEIPAWNLVAIYAYMAVVLVLCFFGFHRLFLVILYYRHKRKEPRPAGEFRELPVVTVQLPIYNELYVVERLIDSVCALDYPREKLEIQVLDDSTDETAEVARAKVAQMRQKGFDIKYIHRDDRAGFKAGALDNGLRQARGEFLAIFDADFVPNPDFLKRTIHYFTNPDVAAVQTRWEHLNRDFSLLTRVQAMFLDGHFIMEHTARNRSGRFINFNGTAGIWRRRAIDEAGGWQHDTLTEDLDLSLRAQMKRWRFVFLPHVATPAELPVEVNGFKSQQHRWTKGAVQTTKKLLPDLVKAEAPWWVKLEVCIHLAGNFSWLFVLLMSLLILPATITRGKYFIYMSSIVDVITFFGCTMSICLFYICSQVELGRGWLGRLLYLPALMSIGVGLSINNTRAVLEGLFNRDSTFVRTPKYNIVSRRDTIKKRKYRGELKALVPALELLMGLYLGLTMYVAYRHGMYLSIPFLGFFAFGFLYMAVLSLLQGRVTAR